MTTTTTTTSPKVQACLICAAEIYPLHMDLHLAQAHDLTDPKARDLAQDPTYMHDPERVSGYTASGTAYTAATPEYQAHLDACRQVEDAVRKFDTEPHRVFRFIKAEAVDAAPRTDTVTRKSDVAIRLAKADLVQTAEPHQVTEAYASRVSGGWAVTLYVIAQAILDAQPEHRAIPADDGPKDVCGTCGRSIVASPIDGAPVHQEVTPAN